jgi:spermidine dehydrogenase
VNRWPHRYADTYNTLFDPVEWALAAGPERPCVAARRPFFRIAIASSDAAASPHTDAALGEAARAVGELPA